MYFYVAKMDYITFKKNYFLSFIAEWKFIINF